MKSYITKLRIALFLNITISLAMTVIYIYTMLYSGNGGISYLPEYSRIADINKFHEGWIETLIFAIVGIYGLHVLLITKKL